MSPSRLHLRNRKKIKAPKRYEDEYYTASPPREESFEESEESSELEEEIYESPKTAKPKNKQPAYRGKVTEFNPNLPPAAFPTLDHPDYVHNGGDTVIDLESHSLGLQGQEHKLADYEAIRSNSSNYLNHDCQSKKTEPNKDPATPVSTAADSTRGASPVAMQKSKEAQKQARGSTLSMMYGDSTDSGPQNPIWASNMARMEEAGRMSDLDRIMLEMETGDEEDVAARPKKVARKGSVPESPAWDDLTVAHKLNLADTIAELFPNTSQVMHQLRLNASQKEELVELLTQRQDREAREEANQQRLQEQTQAVLLQGGSLPQSTFRQMLEENLYANIDEDDHLQTNLTELKKARAYLKYCGLDPTLADSSWDVPSISNALSGTGAKPAQSKSEGKLPSIAAQPLPSPSEGRSSQRPPPFTPSQESWYPSDPLSDPVQHYAQGVQAQHRPASAQALISQHSPAAPLSRVPIQSYRVAPGNQKDDLSASNQSTIRVPQPNFPALEGHSNVSKNVNRGAINKAALKTSGASSLPLNPQEDSLPANSQSLAPNGLPSMLGDDPVNKKGQKERGVKRGLDC